MDAIAEVRELGFPWETSDPFLFCVHHVDAYPAGDAELGPALSLEGRNLGRDFQGKDGFRMYHGLHVPGFPQHPHRGFETVTIVRRGFVDHADSLGAAARFGAGDVQWVTAGRGIVHSEMFPLLRRDADNPLELFQIWLNLPRANKLVDPHFAMLWSGAIPRVQLRDARRKLSEIALVAGALAGKRAPAPPPDSWAAQPEADVAIWTMRMQPGARMTLPAAANPAARRSLFFFAGSALAVGGRALEQHCAVRLRDAGEVELEAGPSEVELLLLQGRPIGEPVVQYGPFVMNTRAEIEQAMRDYQHTQFGGWPWPKDDPTHAADAGRFARHADGRVEHADASER